MKLVAAGPSGSPDLTLVLVIGFLACLYTVNKVAVLMKYPMNDFKRTLAAVVIGCVLLLAVAAALDIHAVPRIHASWKAYLPLIGDVVVFLVAVVPITWFLHRSSYIKAFNMLVLGIAAAAVAMVLTHSAFEAVQHGGKGFDTTRERTESVNDIIK